jgi:hypothetical protein
MGDINREVASANAKYSQMVRKFHRTQETMKKLAALKKKASEPAPPREPGSERSYTFVGATGTRYSDKPEKKEGERRTD